MTTWLWLAIAAVALASWGRQRARTPVDYFAASRSAGPVVAGLAGTAAGLSAFVFVGGPGWFAAAGIASTWLLLSAPLTGTLQCWAVGERIVDLASIHDVVTVPELLVARFGPGWPHGLAAAAVLIGSIATLAVQIKGVAVIADNLLAVPGWQVAVAALVVTTIYTVAGGMRAGVLAEALQGGVMAVAAASLVVATLARAGGPTQALDRLQRLQPELLDPFNATSPVAAVGLFLLFGLGTCAQPHYLQKFLLVRDRASLRWMPAVMTVALLAVVSVWVGVGLGGTALWLDGAIRIERPDELAPAVLAILGGPLLGVATAAVLAAVMSTAASLLNLAAAALTRDLPAATRHRPLDGLLWPRLATVAVAAAATAVAFASERPVALLGVLGWSMFTAALLPTIVLGLAWPGATRRGAIAALAVGPAVQLGLEIARSTAALQLESWEPGLTGAACGTLALVAVSLVEHRHRRGRAPLVRRRAGPPEAATTHPRGDCAEDAGRYSRPARSSPAATHTTASGRAP